MGDAALRNLERAWQGGDPAARQQLAEGFLRRGEPRAAVAVFAEAGPLSAGEAEVYGRAWNRLLVDFQPLERIDGMRAHGELAGWCGPKGRYGVLYNRERNELRMLDRVDLRLLGNGHAQRFVTGVVVRGEDLWVSMGTFHRSFGRWRCDPELPPQDQAHLYTDMFWERFKSAGEHLVGVAEGASLLVGADVPAGFLGAAAPGMPLVPRGPTGSSVGGTPLSVCWLRGALLLVAELQTVGPPQGFDLAASWRKLDPVAAAATPPAQTVVHLDCGALLAGRALVDLDASNVRFAREALEPGLTPRWDRSGGALLGLVGGQLRRVELTPAAPLVGRASGAWSADEARTDSPEALGYWHPRVNAAAVGDSRAAWVGVPSERPGARLPVGSRPLGWTPSGDRLLVERSGGDVGRLEFWGWP